MSWSAQAELGLKIPGETGVRQRWRQQQLERERQKCKRSPGLPWAAKITNLEQSADPTHLPIYLTNDVMLFIGKDPLNCCVIGFHGSPPLPRRTRRTKSARLLRVGGAALAPPPPPHQPRCSASYGAPARRSLAA